jgi:hypothetical protein
VRTDKRRFGFVLVLVLSAGLAACSKSAPDPPTAPALSIGFGLKQFQFTWTPAAGAVTYYKLLINPDGVSGFTQVGNNLSASVGSVSVPVTVYSLNWTAARYALDACNAAGCAQSNLVSPSAGMLQAIGYFKASNTAPNNFFGTSVAISSDGNTLAVGAFGEASSATGIDGNQADQSEQYAGAVYIFTNNGGAWSQQAYIKASNTQASAFFGHAVAISSDGNTLAVGAFGESSAATGVNGNQSGSAAAGSGAVYVFTRTGINWSQQAYVKASNTASGSSFGLSIGLSSDGNTLSAGAPFEASDATGIDGNQSDTSAADSGAVYVFTRVQGVWSQQAYIKASNTRTNNEFGYSTGLSGDGNTLAVGSTGEASAATGIGGNQADTSAQNAGAVYMFARSGSTWSQQAYVKASNTLAGDEFGYFAAVSTDGSTLAAGAPNEPSAATGVGGNQNDHGAPSAGAVYVFARGNNTWLQQAYIKASNTNPGDFFGVSGAFTDNGSTLAVGAESEASAANGIEGNQQDNSDQNAGAVYVYGRNVTTWSEQSYVKPSNTTPGESFGFSVAFSADGSTLAAGAANESGASTGIDGNQSNQSSAFAGAVYLY